MIELFGDVRSEIESGASERCRPSCLLVRVGPNEIAHGSVGGDFLDSVQGADVVELVDDRGESAVKTEDGVVYCF